MSDDTIRENVREFFVKSGIEPCRIVAAVSGGTDSTALLLLLSELPRFTVTCAHVNHHLRGADSDADEAFVRDLCAKLGLELDVADGTLDELAIKDRGIEAAAREVRYARLAEIRERRGARWVATAHQKDDQAETVLMRLLTGSGLAGLRGIHPIRDDGYVRPLLAVTREELAAFLDARNVTPCVDRSNADPRFLRNRLRTVVRELNATENLARIADQAREQWPVLERVVDDAERASVHATADEARFTDMPAEEWLRAALLRRQIRRLDPQARDADVERLARDWDEIGRVSVSRTLELVRGEDGTRNTEHGTEDGAAPAGASSPVPRSVSRVSRSAPLLLRRRPPPMPRADFALHFTSAAYIPELALTIHVGQPATRHERGRQRFQLPADADRAFLVRTRRPGDRFHPLGLSGPKKLKDFLIDRKIAAEARDRLPLLIWNGEIVWVAGVEVSERFKVTSPGGGALYEVWLEGSGGADDADHSRLQR